ncbi:aspartate/tyrosine/aromatic aminotransferase [Bowdeniella nasicola]|uniref:Aspartate/tyrosine/aromatic aminotransferase n=2 Tax=Bowdeniella nasicola TaxID=208480 RepID=A0A1Q5Q3N5_9ACTO|nr:aspartate/tyrosine/aromatic aminotransferase [Bowdeniella nasicola]
MDMLIDAASRPVQAARDLLPLSSAQLNAHPLGHANSIAWLLWHTGRQIDVQVAALSGGVEVWERDGFGKRLGLSAHIGYGMSEDEARAVRSDDQDGLVAYLAAAMDSLIVYVRQLSEEDLAEVIDTSYDPPVTRAVRLVSIVDDAAQHVGQAAYLAGMPELGAGVS